MRKLLGHEFFAPQQWQRRAALWIGGVVVGLAAIVFAGASNVAYDLFRRVLAISPWLPLALTPAVFALLAWLTTGVLKPPRGSGIPQVIAAIEIEDAGFRQRMLSLPVALGKMLLTLVALAGGASVGREGPTVHVGAGLMFWIGRRFGFSDAKALSRFVLAGGGAGIAAAFNTPLAGVVFAIEELAGTYEHRFSGIIQTREDGQRRQRVPGFGQQPQGNLRNDSQCPLGPGEEGAQIIAGHILDHPPASTNDFAGRQDDL